MAGNGNPWTMIIGVVVITAIPLLVMPAAANPRRGDAEVVTEPGGSLRPDALDTPAAVAQISSGESGPPAEYGAAPAEPPPDDDDASSSHLRTVAWVGLGVGAAGWLTWGVTGSISLAQAGSLADDCPDDVCPADLEDDLDTAKTLADVATAGLIVGLTGSIYAVIALLVTPSGDDGDGNGEPDETSASVRPQIGPGYVGLSGQF